MMTWKQVKNVSQGKWSNLSEIEEIIFRTSRKFTFT